MVAVAMPFAIRSDILGALGQEFDLSHQQQGLLQMAASWGYPLTVLLGGIICDIVGMKLLILLACAGHALGILLTIVSPSFGFPLLLTATAILGLADGMVESIINPLVTTLYPGQKTGRLGFLHAGWPFGLIVGGLLCLLITNLTGAGLPGASLAVVSLSWKIKTAMVLVPIVLYGVLSLGLVFPATERKESGVSTKEMLKEGLRPGFLVLLACMGLAAATEIGPDQWFGSALTDTVGIGGIAFLVFTAGIAFVLRYNGGKLAAFFGPFGLLTGSCFLAGLGLFLLGFAFTPLTALGAAALFGLGKSCLWPTILGVTSERYPRGGSFLLAIVSAVGMIVGGMAGPAMGRIYDRYTIAHLPPQVAKVAVVNGKYSPLATEKLTAPADLKAVKNAEQHGAAMTFRWSATMPILPFFIFLAFGLLHRSRGGYRAVRISDKQGIP